MAFGAGSPQLLAVALGVSAVGAGCIGDGEAPLDPCELGQPGTVCGIAGDGERGFNGDGHPAAETALSLVSQARRGPDGRVWLMDHNNHMLRVVGDDGTVATMAGNSLHGFANLDVPATQSRMEAPIDFDFLPTGEPVIVSAHDLRVLRLDDDGMFENVAGTGGFGAGWPWSDADGVPAVDATFIEPNGVVVGPAGEIYVSDFLDHRVRVIRDGRVFAVAGTGEAGADGDGGPAALAKLRSPLGIALGPDGSLYIADQGNHAIRRVRPDGTIETVAGRLGEAGFDGDDGPAVDALLAGPAGVAVTDAGTLYVADSFNYRVRAVAADGTIATIGGTGDNAFIGDGGPAESAAFSLLARLSWSPGELFVADQGNDCARVIHLDD